MTRLDRDRLYHYAIGVGGAPAKTTHATCPTCGRTVRIRTDGRLYRHIAKLATPRTGATQCTNRDRGND